MLNGVGDRKEWDTKSILLEGQIILASLDIASWFWFHVVLVRVRYGLLDFATVSKPINLTSVTLCVEN